MRGWCGDDKHGAMDIGAAGVENRQGATGTVDMSTGGWGYGDAAAHWKEPQEAVHVLERIYARPHAALRTAVTTTCN